MVFTEYPGHARQLAIEAGEFDGIAVVGGDGTLLEVLNGCLHREQRLAIIPTGRGNSLARDLGLYPPALSFEAIRSDRSLRIDLMDVFYRETGGGWRRLLSASTVAVGYPAAVVRSAGGRFRRFGTLGYAAAAACLRPASTEMRVVEGAGSPGRKLLTGFIASNTRHLGNFLSLPRASCHDGHFDVMELHSGFLRQTVHNLSMLSGLQFYSPATFATKTKTALALSRSQELMVDGELIAGVTSLRIRVQASAMEFVCGRQQP